MQATAETVVTKPLDPLQYMLKLFRLTEADVFDFKDRGDYYGLVTRDAKKFKLPKDMLK